MTGEVGPSSDVYVGECEKGGGKSDDSKLKNSKSSAAGHRAPQPPGKEKRFERQNTSNVFYTGLHKHVGRLTGKLKFPYEQIVILLVLNIFQKWQ